MCENKNLRVPIINNKFVFDGKTTECTRCHSGHDYSYIKTCETCNGTKKVLSKTGVKKLKCKNCDGNGYTQLNEPILLGKCNTCEGTKVRPINMYDTISDAEKEYLFNTLFDFTQEYKGYYSEMNEGYFGIKIMCGITDYGRYKSLSEEEFKQTVKENFIRGFSQYIGIVDKNLNLPKKVLIRKSNSGWHAYPIYE